MPYIIGTAKNSGDLYARLKAFITGVGFIGQASFSGAGNGRMIDIRLPAVTYAADVYTVTCQTAEAYGGTFSVTSSQRGVLQDAVVNSSYVDPGVEFYLDFGAEHFAIGDSFTLKFAEYSAPAKPWLEQLSAGKGTITEVITLTCTKAGEAFIDGVQAESPAEFSVSGSVSGSLGLCTQGQLFTTPKVSLKVARGDINSAPAQFALGDTITVYTTANELAELGQQWETLREVAGSGGLDAEWIFKGKGLAGDDEIFVGMQGWTLSGMRGYAPSLSYNEQLGQIPAAQRPALAVRGLSTPYWISVTGRRIGIVIRNDRYYMSAYLGLGIPWGSPKFQPYLLCIGGSGQTWSWSGTSNASANWWCPYIDSNSAVSKEQSQAKSPLQALGRDNVWRGHLVNGYYSEFYDGAAEHVWPYNSSFGVGPNLDGSTPLFPIVLGPHLGEIDGFFAIPGLGSTAAEDIIWKPEGGRKFLVHPNTFRASPFAVMELK